MDRSQPDSNVFIDCTQQLLYSAVQKPVSGVTQLIDGVTGSHLKPATDWLKEPGQAKFGSGQWHAEQVASGFKLIRSNDRCKYT
jgi:hypothetical protein